MTTKKVKDIRELLQQHKLPEMPVSICLRGDLTAEIYRLDAELVEIGKDTQAQGDARLNGNDAARRLGKRIKDLEAEAKQSTITVLLRALPRKDWADLVVKHPAVDKGQDFNVATIFGDAVPASIVEPDMDPETRDKFLDALTQGQFEQLAAAVHNLNVGDGAVPFSVLASRALQNSDGTSKPPAPTG